MRHQSVEADGAVSGPYVYIVCSGERGEGHDPVSVHTTLRGAKKAVAEKLPQAALNRVADCWMATENLVDEWWIVRRRVTT